MSNDHLEVGREGVGRAAMLPHTVYASCPICYGSRIAFDAPCRTCADPDVTVVRKVLERLTSEQMTFLRAYGHTLADQPVTAAEDGACQVEYWIEDDDGVMDDSWDGNWLVPPTRHWFASGKARFGPCREAHFIRYNPLGLLLRECLMAGADARVPHSPPRDSNDSGESGETHRGSTEGNSAGLQASPEPEQGSPNTSTGEEG